MSGVARIRQDDIDAVKERTDIVQLVGTYLTLKKTGHDSLSGLCPFHQEKTASFSVSPSKQVFYCFGCGKGGDAITFLRELEHLSYVEAIERLAQTGGCISVTRVTRSRSAGRPNDGPPSTERTRRLPPFTAPCSREAAKQRMRAPTSRSVGSPPKPSNASASAMPPGTPTSCSADSSGPPVCRRSYSWKRGSPAGATTEPSATG